MARERNVRFRIGAEDDTARGFNSVSRRLRRLGTTAQVAIGNFASGAVQSAITAVRDALRGAVDQLDRAQKLGQVLDLNPSVIRRFQLLGELIGSSGERLAQLARRLRDIAGGAGGQGQRDALEALGLNLQEIANSDADTVLLKYAQALRAVGNQAEASAASTEVVGDELNESALLLAANFEDARRVLGQGINEDLDRAARAAASFNDALTEIRNQTQNETAQGLANLQQSLELTDGEFRSFSKNAIQFVKEWNPITGAIIPAVRAISDFNKETETLNETIEETNKLATFAYVEAPTEGRLILRRFHEERMRQIKEEAEEQKKLDDERKKAAEERERQEEENRRKVTDGLRAIIDLENQRGGRASFGVTGEDVPTFSQPPSAAQQLLNQQTQNQQLQAIREMVKILKTRPTGGGSWI